jgi:hypothetical protein
LVDVILKSSDHKKRNISLKWSSVHFYSKFQFLKTYNVPWRSTVWIYFLFHFLFMNTIKIQHPSNSNKTRLASEELLCFLLRGFILFRHFSTVFFCFYRLKSSKQNVYYFKSTFAFPFTNHSLRFLLIDTEALGKFPILSSWQLNTNYNYKLHLLYLCLLVYVDSDVSSNNAVNLIVASGGSSFTRSFSIKVTQLECTSWSKGVVLSISGSI